MNLFFDTSALVKYFHEEEGSESVTKLIISEESSKWVSELVRIEFLSALFRRYRKKEIDDDKIAKAVSGFQDEIASFHIEPLGQAVLIEAETLLNMFGKMHGLRALDALHLGSFSLVAEKDWYFVAADDGLCKVAHLMGFKTVNPLK